MSDAMHSEAHLYALWERYAVTGRVVRAHGGERIVVISPGSRNDSSGPDYPGAVLLVDGELRSGAVEMHCSERDWFAHQHQHDPAYRQVILHLLDAAPDGPLRLSIPTITAADLGEQGMAPASPQQSSEVSSELPAELLGELSWSRVLRRVTEIIRTEIQSDPVADIRRAFLRRLFDCLGYSRNRAPMQGVALRVLEHEAVLEHGSFDDAVALIFRSSGIDRERFIAAGRSFMSLERLTALTDSRGEDVEPPCWRYDTRPANAPERRLWGAAKLTFDLYHNRLLGRLLEGILAGNLRGNTLRLLMPRFGHETFVGTERAVEIIVNAVVPVAIAAGIALPHPRLLESACRAYRTAPSLASNRIVRQIERRYLNGERLQGAFWQQGAIEFHQRYINPDRRALSMIAEPVHHILVT